jgi:hypothetical protein
MGTWGLRLKPGRVDQVISLLSENVIAIGWSDSDQLLNRPLSKDDFRAILKRDYPDENLANALEHTWRFIREIALGDVAAVPHGDDVYFVQIAGDAYSEPAGADTDTVIRRPIIRLLDACAPTPDIDLRVGNGPVSTQLLSFQSTERLSEAAFAEYGEHDTPLSRCAVSGRRIGSGFVREPTFGSH